MFTQNGEAAGVCHYSSSLGTFAVSMDQTNYTCTVFFTQNMELGSDAKRQGKIKGSNKACDPNPLCFWVLFPVPLKITLCRKMEPNTGTFWTNFHVFTDHNKFRENKSSCPCISDSGQTLKTGKQGEPLLFISLQKLMKAEHWCI